jgi:hypothetical protein
LKNQKRCLAIATLVSQKLCDALPVFPFFPHYLVWSMTPSGTLPGGCGHETGESLFFDGGVRTPRAMSSFTLSAFMESIIIDKNRARTPAAQPPGRRRYFVDLASSSRATSPHRRLQIQMLLFLVGCFRLLDEPKPEA